MTFVYFISREPKLRTTVSDYLQDRGYDTATADSYDTAMEELPGAAPDALVVDVQGVPRGELGATFANFNQWLAARWREGHPPLVYLLHKGARRPAFRLAGIVIKKPFPVEALGEALREKLGHPRAQGSGPGLELDLTTNTLRADERVAHLTNI